MVPFWCKLALDLGSDEFDGTDKEPFSTRAASTSTTTDASFRYLSNCLSDELAKDGRGVWMYQDGLTLDGDAIVPLSKDFRVVHSGIGISAQDLADTGYDLIGSPSALYHDL